MGLAVNPCVAPAAGVVSKPMLGAYPFCSILRPKANIIIPRYLSHFTFSYLCFTFSLTHEIVSVVSEIISEAIGGVSVTSEIISGAVGAVSVASGTISETSGIDSEMSGGISGAIGAISGVI